MIEEIKHFILGRLTAAGTFFVNLTTPTPAPLPLRENISYIDDGLEAHMLDIIYPAAYSKPAPVIVYIHGGGFGMNSKDKQYRKYGLRLAKNKFAVVNINFRLSETAKFPAQIEDVLSVLTFLEQNGSQYGLDINNVFLSGDSSGAYMAAMAACVLTNERLREHYGFKADIRCRALAANCGMFDFTSFMDEEIRFPMKKEIVEMLFGSPEYTELPVFEYSSVLRFITRDYPPAYLMDTEVLSFAREARLFASVLKQNGVPHRLHIFGAERKLMHVFNVKGRRRESDIVLRETFEFFTRHLAG